MKTFNVVLVRPPKTEGNTPLVETGIEGIQATSPRVAINKALNSLRLKKHPKYDWTYLGNEKANLGINQSLWVTVTRIS